MMYNNKLSACIKVNSKVLREHINANVFIPYGAEYTISIKNHNSIKAAVTVEIDGTYATDGLELIVGPNETLEFKRFIKNGDMAKGNAFKFIERTSGIENHRGITQDDGLVRIQYQFERTAQPTPQYIHHPYGYIGSPTPMYSYNSGPHGNVCRSSTLGATSGTGIGGSTHNINNAHAASADDVGITVPGQVTNQQFKMVTPFQKSSESHVIVLHLLGETPSGTSIVAPITVNSKPKCTSCGKSNKTTSKFCRECGTSLVLY